MAKRVAKASSGQRSEKRTSITIDPALWKEVKLQAIREEKKIQGFVADVLRSYLEKVNR